MAKVSLADRLEKTPYRIGNGVKTWFQRLDAETQAALEEIRTRYRAGGYPHHSKTEIFEFCVRELNLPCKRQAFVRWLDEKPNG